MKVFWPWQSDRPQKTGRYFVRDVLKAAAKELGEELKLQDANRPEPESDFNTNTVEIDYDTLHVPGIPPINDTINEKIRDAYLFVGDLTPVARVKGSEKAVPNPNVMMELSLALELHGYSRIVLIANRAHFKGLQDLPFDLRHRRGPVIYDLPDGADPHAINDETSKLKGKLKPILRFHADRFANMTTTEAEPPSFKPFGDLSRWFEDGGMATGYEGKLKRELLLPRGAHAYLRVRPSQWPIELSVSDVSPDNSGELFTGTGSNGNWIRMSKAFLHYEYSNAATSPIVVTQWRSDTGEIWFVSNAFIEEAADGWVHGNMLLARLESLLSKARSAYAAVNANGPFQVRAGLVGIRDKKGGFFEMKSGERSTDDRVDHDGLMKDLSNEAIRDFLITFFNSMTEPFGYSRQLTEDTYPYVVRRG